MTFRKTPSLNKIKLLYECGISHNEIVKKVEILVLKKKDFGTVYVKLMVQKWCAILVIHRQ